MVISMRRNAMDNLIKWKHSEDRKPMVLKGARQVGKTWLLKEFGRQHYKNFVYFNFDEEDALKSIFESNKNPQRILELLALIAGQRIQPEDTLIIFDEIQECPAALSALKYFREKARRSKAFSITGFWRSAIITLLSGECRSVLLPGFNIRTRPGSPGFSRS